MLGYTKARFVAALMLSNYAMAAWGFEDNARKPRGRRGRDDDADDYNYGGVERESEVDYDA